MSVASAEARTAEKVSHWSPWLSVPPLGNHLQLRVLLNLQQASEVAEPCAQFGNVSYLVAEDYDAWHRQAVAKAPRLDLKELKAQNGKPFKKLPKVLHVVPYVHEEFLQYAEAAGLSPRNTKGSIPADVRSEHYGTVVGRIVSQQVPLLMLDKRSQLGLLRPEEQLRFNVNFEVVPGSQGKSCVEVCQSRNAKCDKQQIYFLNDCNLLKKHFPCEAGCAHQVGKELPVYVPDPAQSTKGQCLITFISPATCEAKHKSTSRLCPCSVAAKADAVRPAFVTVHGSRVRTKKNIWLCHAESHAAKILAETCISRSACRHCRYQVGSVAHRSCRVRANTRHSEKPSSQRIDSLSTDHAVLFGVFMFVSMVISIVIIIIIIKIIIIIIIFDIAIYIYDYDY
ncbi:unnamed protein product [Symbiodinium necroappetens]|uniref:Uncharacterized protein n=1 Tax=Symbiodinium necroappetens TaxID=1628268 RepID=A0A812L8G2_9DINO|nr:unnamed protein product [Symbiodinium necroappetens]